LDETPLDPLATTVDETHLREPLLGRRPDVLLNDRHHVSRRERMQIQFALDRHRVGIVGHCSILQSSTTHWPFLCVAVTEVVMPPRAEKSPTTVISCGSSSETRSSRI